jgi:hypothetical protein
VHQSRQTEWRDWCCTHNAYCTLARTGLSQNHQLNTNDLQLHHKSTTSQVDPFTNSWPKFVVHTIQVHRTQKTKQVHHPQETSSSSTRKEGHNVKVLQISRRVCKDPSSSLAASVARHYHSRCKDLSAGIGMEVARGAGSQAERLVTENSQPHPNNVS